MPRSGHTLGVSRAFMRRVFQQGFLKMPVMALAGEILYQKSFYCNLYACLFVLTVSITGLCCNGG